MTEAFQAVFAGFSAVRSKSAHESEAGRLKPRAVIAAGLVAALVLVLPNFAIVKLATG